MEVRIEKKRFYTDQERYEWCRKCKLSGMPVTTFARKNGLSRETLRDWMNAYNYINGKFINVNTVSENVNNLIEDKDVKVNILSEVEKIKKSISNVRIIRRSKVFIKIIVSSSNM